jgi:hypothetical protein
MPPVFAPAATVHAYCWIPILSGSSIACKGLTEGLPLAVRLPLASLAGRGVEPFNHCRSQVLAQDAVEHFGHCCSQVLMHSRLAVQLPPTSVAALSFGQFNPGSQVLTDDVVQPFHTAARKY